jgi:pyridoxine 4-dehydrogenase
MSDASAAGSWLLGDRMVNRLGFGATRLAAREVFASAAVSRDRRASVAVLRRAVELGVNHIDTAAFYFSSRLSANELINTALAPYPGDLVVATKVGPGRNPDGSWATWSRPDQLRGQVEENLRQLGRESLDLVYYRASGPGSIAEHVGALADLRQQGLVQQLGVSAVTVDQFEEAASVAPIVSVENRFGIGAREDGGVLALARARGVAFVPYFSIAGRAGARGAVAGEHPDIERIARAHDGSAAQVRLAWTLAQGENVLAIPGTGDLDHLAENVAAAALNLTATEIAELNELQLN